MNVQMLIMKGLMADMSEEDQKKINDTADELRAIINRNRAYGLAALALVGLEEQENA